MKAYNTVYIILVCSYAQVCALLCVFLILVEQYAIKLPIQVQCTLCTFINIASCSSEFYTFKCGHAFYYCFVLFSFMYSVNIL